MRGSRNVTPSSATAPAAAETTFKVAKPFATANRRFAAGAPIGRADDIAPHDFDDFLARGFIAADAPAD